ncbi:MAG: hypothetical protein ABIP94_12835, partial [Planctomycetota bacterium]
AASSPQNARTISDHSVQGDAKPPDVGGNPVGDHLVVYTTDTALLQVTNLGGGPLDITIPPGLAGQTLWVQAVTRKTTGGNPTYSDAQLVVIQ